MKNSSLAYHLKSILPFVLPYWKMLIVSLICSILFAASNVYAIPLIKDIAKEVSNKNFVYFSNHIINAFLLFTIRLSSKYFQVFIMEKVSYRILLNLRLSIYQLIHYLPTDEYSEKKHGDILSRITDDCQKVKDAIYLNFESLIPNVLTFICVTGYLFFLDVQLAALSIFGAPIFIVSLNYFSKRLRRVSLQIQQRTGDIAQMIQETLSNMKIIHTYTYENANIAKFNRTQNRNMHSYIQQVKLRITREQIDAYIQFIIFLLIIWFGGTRVLNNSMTSPELMSFFTGIILLVDPGVVLSKIYATTYQSTASIERINAFLSKKSDINQQLDTDSNSLIQFHNIQFKNVYFQYPSAQSPCLKDISINVSSGDLIGIVGPSGSGKSTIANLISKFYVPTSGNIIIDGMDITSIDRTCLRQNIALVPQESLLFRGSILENCKIGNPSASTEAVITALKIANAWEFVSQLPDKLLTKIGTQGLKLSGGQRQRISIARAIVSNPSLLILDEATSALDSRSESEIQTSIQALKGKFTIFIIAHRLSTIQSADRIIVLQDGIIHESGTHTELMNKQSLYYDLAIKQNLQEKS